MSLYARQREFFRQAYETGDHGWPITEPCPFVVKFIKGVAPRRGKVLDIGCGEGRHTFLFARAGYQAVGCDYEPLAIRRAVRIGKKAGIRSGFHFLLADAFHLPFHEGSFDVILDYGCLHHVKKKDFPGYRQGLLSPLKEGGHLLLSCFSTRFKHYPGERRTRDWLAHRKHYDRFFRKRDFPALFGRDCEILTIEEERQDHHAFWHVLMRKR